MRLNAKLTMALILMASGVAVWSSGGALAIVGSSGRLCFEVAGSSGDAAIVNLTPVDAQGWGNGQLVSSDVATPPRASNVNFGPGSVDPNVAVVKIGADGKVCFVNSKHTNVQLVADHLGTIAASSYTPATASGAPDRKVDTRIGKGGPMVGPSSRLCFAVAGSPGDAAIVNLTPVEAQGAGNGQLVSSDVVKPPLSSNANFGPGSVDPNVAVVKIGADGKVCFINSKHTSVHLVADHLGTIAASSYTPATASGAPDRKVDTRIGKGGSMVGPSGRLCFTVSGSPGDAAILTLTPVEAQGPGNGQLVSSDVVKPSVASNVNFGPGSVDPNIAVAKIGADGKVCYSNSKHTKVHLVADHLGTIKGSPYTPATASGAPDRVIDTRTNSGSVSRIPLSLGSVWVDNEGLRAISFTGGVESYALTDLASGNQTPIALPRKYCDVLDVSADLDTLLLACDVSAPYGIFKRSTNEFYAVGTGNMRVPVGRLSPDGTIALVPKPWTGTAPTVFASMLVANFPSRSTKEISLPDPIDTGITQDDLGVSGDGSKLVLVTGIPNSDGDRDVMVLETETGAIVGRRTFKGVVKVAPNLSANQVAVQTVRWDNPYPFTPIASDFWNPASGVLTSIDDLYPGPAPGLVANQVWQSDTNSIVTACFCDGAISTLVSHNFSTNRTTIVAQTADSVEILGVSRSGHAIVWRQRPYGQAASELVWRD